ALKPQNVAGLATERSTPVIKTNGLTSKPALKLAKSSRPRPELIPVRLPPAPVRSDSKMARNQAGITTRELEHFRDLLFQKRRELTGDVSSMENTALSTGSGSLSTLPMHMADAGTDNYEQEFTLGLVEKDRKLLRDINVALAKIQDGSYGICEGTGKPIAKPRLEAQPWAKYSIEHARALERPQFRRAF
ncbi:MAG: yocK, partial [Phycisphaerales bacterium]|nr:yocK [Phycisphaerales bacterium]